MSQPNDTAVYGIEGVMTNVVGGWLLALDRPFQGEKGDTLTIEDSSPPVSVAVLGIIASDGGATRDIVIVPIPQLHDPRLLTGRRLVVECR